LLVKAIKQLLEKVAQNSLALLYPNVDFCSTFLKSSFAPLFIKMVLLFYALIVYKIRKWLKIQEKKDIQEEYIKKLE